MAVLMKVHFVFMNRIHFKRKKARGGAYIRKACNWSISFYFCLQVDGPVIVTGAKK